MRSPGRKNLDGILPVVEGVGVPQHRAWDPGLLEMDQTARALDPKGNKSSWAAWYCCDLMKKGTSSISLWSVESHAKPCQAW